VPFLGEETELLKQLLHKARDCSLLWEIL